MKIQHADAGIIVQVAVATACLVASGSMMVGPQSLVIVPTCLTLALWFGVRRSYWSLVLFGYPFTFGIISAWMGYFESPGYERTLPFAFSIGIGLVGCVLIAVGLSRILNSRTRPL